MKARAWLPERIEEVVGGPPIPVGEVRTVFVRQLPADINLTVLAVVELHPADNRDRIPVHFHLEGPDQRPWDITVRAHPGKRQSWTAVALTNSKFEGLQKAGRYLLEVRTPASRDPIVLEFEVAFEH